MNTENNSQKQWLPLWISISIFAGMVIGFTMRDQFPSSPFFSFEKKSILGEIETLIKKRYVDDVEMKSINDSAIETILSKLDPHSIHIPSNELQAVNDDIHGQFVGVGIHFMVIQDTPHVIGLMPNGTAGKAGVEIGDLILEADGKSLIALNSDSVQTKIKGTENSYITLTIKRNRNIQKLKIARSRISISSVAADHMLNKDVGYIKLSQFTTATYREFMESLTDLKKKGMKKLILDLRGNTGGVLDEAVDIADEFLSGDKLITYTEGKHQPKTEYRCKREGQFENGDLILLSDGESASASEIILGAMQDWDRALILGSRSFGKGLVQEQYDLSDKSALRLTVARYFTPVGRCIQRSYVNGNKAYFLSRKKTDSSRGKVFLSSKGKKLYDGGGIEPDENINQDSLINHVYEVLNEKEIDISIMAYKVFMSLKKSGALNTNQNFPSDWYNIFPDSVSSSIKSLPPNETQILTQMIQESISQINGAPKEFQQLLIQNDPVIKAAILKFNQ